MPIIAGTPSVQTKDSIYVSISCVIFILFKKKFFASIPKTLYFFLAKKCPCATERGWQVCPLGTITLLLTLKSTIILDKPVGLLIKLLLS